MIVQSRAAIRVVKNIIDVVNRIPGVDIDTSALDRKLAELEVQTATAEEAVAAMGVATENSNAKMDAAATSADNFTTSQNNLTTSAGAAAKAISSQTTAADSLANALDRARSAGDSLAQGRAASAATDDLLSGRAFAESTPGQVRQSVRSAEGQLRQMQELFDITEASFRRVLNDPASTAASKQAAQDLLDERRRMLEVAQRTFERAVQDQKRMARDLERELQDTLDEAADKRRQWLEGLASAAREARKLTNAEDAIATATTELSDTIAAQTEELERSKLEQALMGDSSKELELAQLRLAWAVEDNEDATADYNSALNHSQMLMSDSKTSAEQLATANDALTSSYRRVVEAQNAFRTAQANVRRAGGGGSGSGVSGGGGGGSGSSVRDGIATFVETTTDAAGWTLSRTTTDDFDGNRRTTVTGTRSDGSTFQTDDETFESAEQSNRGMALGGIVRSRPGGMRVTVAEGGQDEAIVPLSEFPHLLTESLRFERAGFGAVQPTPISIENRISLTLGRQQFEDLMLETRESLRLQRRW